VRTTEGLFHPQATLGCGESVDAQVRQLTKAGCKKVFTEVASGAKTDRAQLRRLLDVLDAGDVLTGHSSTGWRDPPATC
jgi:DNA invertase Pin-like site-specific DNA recombinase